MAFDSEKVFLTKQTENAAGERVIQELNEQGFVLSEKADPAPPGSATAEDRVFLDALAGELAVRGLTLDDVRDAVKRDEDEQKARRGDHVLPEPTYNLPEGAAENGPSYGSAA